MLKYFHVLALIFLCEFIYSQNDSININSYYFNDGGVSNTKNVFKINCSSIIAGDLPIQYERVITNVFTLEVGVGILLPYYTPEFPINLQEESYLDNPESGYSLWIQPKFYVGRNAPDLVSMGIQIRQRNYFQNNEKLTFTDITYNLGYQYIFGKRYIFDVNYGLGFRIGKTSSSSKENETLGFCIPVGIKLGILL